MSIPALFFCSGAKESSPGLGRQGRVREPEAKQAGDNRGFCFRLSVWERDNYG